MNEEDEIRQEEIQPEADTDSSCGENLKPQNTVPFSFSAPRLSTEISGSFDLTNPLDKKGAFTTNSTLISNQFTKLNFTNEFQINKNNFSYTSRALNLEHQFDNKSSDAALNINLTDNDGNYSFTAGGTYSSENIGTNITTNASVASNDGNITYSASATVHNESNIAGASITTDANVTVDNGDFNYSVQTAGEKEIKGVNNSATLYSDKSQSYLSFSSSKKKNIQFCNGDEAQTHNLINIDNPNGNEEQLRVQQLKENNYVFNFMTKEGYSAEKSSFFSENSLIAMLGKTSYTNLTHRMDKHSQFFDCKVDLSKFNINYNYNDETSEDNINTISHKFSSMYKGRKTLVALDASKEKRITPDEEKTNTYTIGINTSYGRDEYSNIFNSGFNFQTAGSIVLNDAGKADGYEASADVAWNRYGSEHGGKNDVLLLARCDTSKKNNIKKFNASFCSLFRFNNEWTSIEPQIHYSSVKADGNTEKTMNYHLGFYQEIGKKWGDAYFSVVGEYEQNLRDKSKNYAGVIASVKKQATKRLTFGAEGQYYTNTGLSGNVNMQVNF